MKADKDKTIRKLKTVSGQIDGLIKMIEDDRYCIDISNQVMASISILKNINKDVLRGHLEHCVYDSLKQKNEKDIKEKIDEIEKIIDKLNKI
ncbi:metal-sensing transcriptional repressor [Anaerococcus degeneri]|uniref:Copper-sensing transcriptional repressor CsoR n=1 Tax=Anaerococcus degeneri TaxID=361500 RepID=A0ABS7YY88_9FIRM|nr:metal-sensing transcriptional repressor [Anaerococcus degeneri]MBP2015077.1 DNA-binding FrmR family transcriptional regulator [Anaerococcus degeneri]MCA2095337.1 metal-sensing transcriptional repressor [Anaerococcus degeneri]